MRSYYCCNRPSSLGPWTKSAYVNSNLIPTTHPVAPSFGQIVAPQSWHQAGVSARIYISTLAKRDGMRPWIFFATTETLIICRVGKLDSQSQRSPKINMAWKQLMMSSPPLTKLLVATVMSTSRVYPLRAWIYLEVLARILPLS